jgi:O-antigen ligase
MSLVASRPIMFGVQLGALLLTATRGAALCLVVGVLGHFLMVASGRIRPAGKRMRWGIAAVMVGWVVWLSPLSEVLMGRLSDASLRPMAMQMGISAVLENPLLGTGFNGFSHSRPAVVEDWLITKQAQNGLLNTTNQYIQTATDGGLVALVCLLLFVFFTGRNALRVIRWRSATPQLVGLHLWLIAVLAGNHGSLWFLSNTGSGFFIFAVAGLAARASALAAKETAPRRRVA